MTVRLEMAAGVEGEVVVTAVTVIIEIIVGPGDMGGGDGDALMRPGRIMERLQ